MLEQWEADRLLRAPKVYSGGLTVDLGRGADNDYPVETDDGNDHFLLDIRGPGRNPGKARYQLRYRRTVVLARMCLAVPHTNSDGTKIGSPHLHRYDEEFGDKEAEEVGPFSSLSDALLTFCQTINLPAPNIQGGP